MKIISLCWFGKVDSHEYVLVRKLLLDVCIILLRQTHASWNG